MDGDQTYPNTIDALLNNSTTFSNITTFLYYNWSMARTYDSSENATCLLFRFTFYGMITGLVCIVGVVGNTLSILVLQKYRSNRVAAFLLQSLAVADNFVLITSFIVFTVIHSLLPYIHDDVWTVKTTPYIQKYVQPLAYMGQTATIWLTVLLSFNRYIAICKPFKVNDLCTPKRVRIQVLVIALFSILYNFPRFFQYSIGHMTVPLNGHGSTEFSRPTKIHARPMTLVFK